MQDPWNNTWGKWKLQNLNDAHFYQMSNTQDDNKPGLFKRIMQVINREWIVLRCRIEALSRSPGFMADQQCECLES
jgi:hypothetical protein